MMFRQGGRIVSTTIIKPVFFVVAAVLAFSVSVGSTQETGRVAVLDVAEVFKENASFDTGPTLGTVGFTDFRLSGAQLKTQIKAHQNRIVVEAEKFRELERLCRQARAYFDAYCRNLL